MRCFPSLLLPALVVLAYACSLAAEPGLYNLADFGPTATPAQAKATYDAALARLGKIGGLLVIPADVAKQLAIENTAQIAPRTPAPLEETKSWLGDGPGITIIEVNENQTIIKVPPITGLKIPLSVCMR